MNYTRAQKISFIVDCLANLEADCSIIANNYIDEIVREHEAEFLAYMAKNSNAPKSKEVTPTSKFLTKYLPDINELLDYELVTDDDLK